MALAEFIVSFREVFEMGMVLGIMVAYLEKSGKTGMKRAVFAGAALAIAASVLAAAAFGALAGGYEKNEPLFEGIALVLACVFVTWLNLWVFAQKDVRGGIEKRMAAGLEGGQALGVAAFSFVAVFREGVELVIFLGGISVSSGTLDVAYAAAGAIAAAALSYAIFRQFVRLDLRLFFKVTTILLALLAAGLLAQGVHELQEAGVLPTSVARIYDITPPMNADGSYPLMHEEGAIGSVLNGTFGYQTAPSLEQAVAYFGYLAGVFLAYRRVSGKGRV